MAKPDLELRQKVMSELPDTAAMALPARIIAERLGIHPAIVGASLRSLRARMFVEYKILREKRPYHQVIKGKIRCLHLKKKHYWKIKETEDVIKP